MFEFLCTLSAPCNMRSVMSQIDEYDDDDELNLDKSYQQLFFTTLLIVKVIFVITVFLSFLCVSTILMNKDDHNANSLGLLRVV